MKKAVLSLAVVVLLSLSGGTAFAQSCSSGPTGPHYLGGGPIWFDYSKDASCYSTNGNVTQTTVCSDDGWTFGTGSNQWATYTFEVTEAETYFEAYSDIYFNDPNNSSGNVIILDAYVDHPSGPDDYYQLFSWDGTDGDLTSCLAKGNTFSASTGDMVTISVVVGKSHSNATIQANEPRIFTVQ